MKHTPSTPSIWDEVINTLHQAEFILLTTHVTPDADGVGSQLALYHALQALGKKVHIHNRDPLPRICRFLEGADQASQGDSYPHMADVDVIVSLDCGAKSRLGFDAAFFDGKTLINLDHHVSNPGFGDINIVDASYCATGAMTFELIKRLDVPLNAAMASALYAAFITDTHSFQLNTVTPAVHEMVAELLRAGADAAMIARKIYASHSTNYLRLLKRSLNTLEVRDHGQSAWLHVDQQMMQETDTDVEDTEDLINFARNIEGVEIAVFIREFPNGDWKVSFRGKTYAHVGNVAKALGGGGHPYASGCTLHGTLDEVRQQLRPHVSQALQSS